MSSLRLLLFNIFLFSAANVAAQDSSECPVNQIFLFNQTLNHDLGSSSASAGNGTFTQRYQLNTTFFRPGGPILFFQNAEASMACIETTVLQDWAEDMGAILASIEHRCFGDSVPTGFNSTTAKPEDYAPLTMNNTLLDSVNLIDWIKKTVPHANNSEAIVMGGSYGGTLTALLRLFHPETIYGALSSAPLLKSFGPESENKDRFEWFKWVSQVYRDQSAEASAKIKNATFYFNSSFESQSKLNELANEMRLCEPYPSNSTDWSTFYSSLLLTYYLGPQFNYHFANPDMFNVSRPLDIIVNQTLAANSTGEVLRVPAQLWDLRLPNECLRWNSSRFGAGSVLQADVWQRIECLSIAGSTIDIAPGGIFPPRDNLVDHAAQCKAMGLSPSFALMSNEEIIEKYHFTVPDLLKAKRILFTEGAYDPTTAVAAPVFPVSNDRDATRTVLGIGLAHTEETFSQDKDLLPGGISDEMKQMQLAMKNIVKGWLDK